VSQRLYDLHPEGLRQANVLRQEKSDLDFYWLRLFDLEGLGAGAGSTISKKAYTFLSLKIGEGPLDERFSNIVVYVATLRFV